MKYISFKSIPYIDFAHRYFTEKYDLPLPYSKNTIEFTYHHIGDSYILNEDGSTQFVPENSIFCLLHNVKRRVHSNTYQDHYSVCINCDYEIVDKPAKYSFPLIELIDNNEIVLKIASKIKYIIIQKQSGTLDSFQEASLIFELLSMYCKYEEANQLVINNLSLAYKIIHYVNKAKKYISNNIDKQISVEEIASYLNISCGYLSKIFKESTGESLITYINKSKLNIILELVENKKCSLYEACEQLNLNDPNYVSHMFTKYYGKTFSDLLKKDNL